eukprot:1457005-Pleurochrysis_carterae.AAC.4
MHRRCLLAFAVAHARVCSSTLLRPCPPAQARAQASAAPLNPPTSRVHLRCRLLFRPSSPHFVTFANLRQPSLTFADLR